MIGAETLVPLASHHALPHAAPASWMWTSGTGVGHRREVGHGALGGAADGGGEGRLPGRRGVGQGATAARLAPGGLAPVGAGGGQLQLRSTDGEDVRQRGREAWAGTRTPESPLAATTIEWGLA